MKKLTSHQYHHLEKSSELKCVKKLSDHVALYEKLTTRNKKLNFEGFWKFSKHIWAGLNIILTLNTIQYPQIYRQPVIF